MDSCMFVMHIAGYKHFPDFFTIYYTIYWLPYGMLEWVCIQHPVGSLFLIVGNLVKYLYLEVTANNWFGVYYSSGAWECRSRSRPHPWLDTRPGGKVVPG